MKDDELVKTLMLMKKNTRERSKSPVIRRDRNSDMIPFETKPKHRQDRNTELVLTQVRESTLSLNRQKEKFSDKMINYTNTLYDDLEAEDALALNKLILSIDSPYFDQSIENAERKIITSKRYPREVTALVNKMLFEVITFKKTVQLEVSQYNNMIGGVNSIRGLTNEQNTGIMAEAQLVIKKTENTLAVTFKNFVGKMTELLMVLFGLIVSGVPGYSAYKIISILSDRVGMIHDSVYTSIIGLGGYNMPMITNCLPDTEAWSPFSGKYIIKGECTNVADKSSYLYKFIESTIGSLGGTAAFFGETGAIVVGFCITISMLLWFTSYTRGFGISVPFLGSFKLGRKSLSTKRKTGRKSTKKSKKTGRKSTKKSKKTRRKSTKKSKSKRKSNTFR